MQDCPYSYMTREECVDAAELAASDGSPSSHRGTEWSVLCVQPNPMLREPLQQALAGYRGILASSSLDAMRL